MGKAFVTVEFESDDPLRHLIGLKRLVLDSVSGNMGPEYAGTRLTGHDVWAESDEA